MVSAYPVLAISLLRVTPSAKRNSYRVAILFCINTQGRGAAHLNPGLGKRNSYRVARGAYHPQWATYIIEIGRARHQNTSYIQAHEHYTLQDEHHVSSGNFYINAHKHHTLHSEHHGSSGNSYIHAYEHYTLHGERHVSSGNSVGVAIPQPRVAGEARYPG